MPSPRMFGRPSVCPLSVSGADLSYCTHTSHRGQYSVPSMLYALQSHKAVTTKALNKSTVVLLLTFGFARQIFYRRFISGEDLGNPWVCFFHAPHTHPLGGVDVPSGVYEL